LINRADEIIEQPSNNTSTTNANQPETQSVETPTLTIPAPLAAQQAAPASAGYTSSWFSGSAMLTLLGRLLLRFGRWRVLTVGFNVLRVQGIKIYRVQQQLWKTTFLHQ